MVGKASHHFGCLMNACIVSEKNDLVSLELCILDDFKQKCKVIARFNWTLGHLDPINLVKRYGGNQSELSRLRVFFDGYSSIFERPTKVWVVVVQMKSCFVQKNDCVALMKSIHHNNTGSFSFEGFSLALHFEPICELSGKGP